MCGIANLQRIENEIKRRANRRPVHWLWQVAMIACLAMVLWFVFDVACNWIDAIMVVQAQMQTYSAF